LVLLLAGVSALWQGCSPTYYKGAADREVYRILATEQARTLGVVRGFTIDPPEESPLERLRRVRPAAAPGREGALSVGELEPAKVPGGLPKREGAIPLTLRDGLSLAARHSREYQSQKEDLYLGALTLTLERFKWKPQLLGTLFAKATHEKTGGETPDETKIEGGSKFSVEQLLWLGGSASVQLATDLSRFATGLPRETAASALAVKVLQPLWKGAGWKIARENLTQAERDTAYGVRTFARFQKSFCVDVTSKYYRVLQQRDAVLNQWQNWDRIRQERERTEAMAKAGRLPELQVDQARQKELDAANDWVTALQGYQEQLDQFRVALSLPADASVDLDPAEIDRVRAAGLLGAPVSLERAMELGLGRRLDLLNAIDQVADAERKVDLARNGLAPEVNLELNASLATVRPRRPLSFSSRSGTYDAGITAELPLRRKEERNAYRQSLIAFERARRSADEVRDQVRLSVRQAWRNLQEAAESYRIQRASVALARRRVESASLLLQRGDATARDVLEAAAALVRAQNALTRTLIDHTLARLALLRDTELLSVDREGVWQEAIDVK